MTRRLYETTEDYHDRLIRRDQPARLRSPSVAEVAFQIGDRVEKYTGDYQLPGEIRSAFITRAGKARFVVEHDPGFLHIYGPQNLRLLTAAPKATETPGLREAAALFVKHYADWMDKWPDDQEVSVYPRHTYGQIRALIAALSATPQPVAVHDDGAPETGNP